MAKKKTKKEEVEVPVVETPVVETPKTKKIENPKKPHIEDNWEIKDRTYFLKNGKTPLSYMIRSNNIFWFDEDKGYERELKYTVNQRTPFVDEFKGDARLAHIIFRSGSLFVPKQKQTLQKLLSLYHPHKDSLYAEYEPVKRAESQLDWLEFEIAALQAASNLDINMMEAVLRAEIGSKVSEMSSSEIKRDTLLFAKQNPQLFLELVTDENIQLRNFGIKATEMNILKLSDDQRNFTWASTGRKLMTVPFDEHPYSALAAWFKTDEGMEVYSNIEKRLK
tara:strand:- start:1893 stop:2729 length:837 start_codon:yes stop_codon:yes gene_type:complete